MEALKDLCVGEKISMWVDLHKHPPQQQVAHNLNIDLGGVRIFASTALREMGRNGRGSFARVSEVPLGEIRLCRKHGSVR